MQLFTFIRKFYHRLGINPPDTNNINNINRSFNWRNSFILLCLSTFWVLSAAFLSFKADTIAEFGASFYVSITVLLYLIFWTMMILKTGDFFVILEEIDKFIAESMWSHQKCQKKSQEKLKEFSILGYNSTARDIYTTLNEKIERVSKLIGSHFVILQIISVAILTFFRAALNYYILDLGEDSFELPALLVCV